MLHDPFTPSYNNMNTKEIPNSQKASVFLILVNGEVYTQNSVISVTMLGG